MVARGARLTRPLSAEAKGDLGRMRFQFLVRPIPCIMSDYIGSDLDSLGGGFFVLLYYLPIYFQAVLNTSAEQSGVRNLALIVASSEYAHCIISPLPFPFSTPISARN